MRRVTVPFKTSFGPCGSLRAAALVVAALWGGAAVTATAQIPPPVSPAVATFVDATNDYAAMHRRLERITGPIELNSTTDAINRAIGALAIAIRAERRDARQGDLFTPALAVELRGRINDALFEHGFTADDLRADQRLDDFEPGTVKLRVNGPFWWVLASAMFPCVIEALPPLPPELQYRIVGDDLILVDVHASLVVDILPNALAQMTMVIVRP